MEALIVIYGNPVDGFSYCGPFQLRGDALAWADDNVSTEYDWWVTNLQQPEEK
jgi:hypothetical protein